MITTIIHFLLLLGLPPLLLGVINRVKAFFAGRRGPPLLQTWRDIIKLMRKDVVLSSTTSWIFRVSPAVSLATMLVAGSLLPFGSFASPLAFEGDLILFAYLFGLARFFTASAALDTGSAFEGMGASREVTFAFLTEPALFLALLVLSKVSGSLILGGIVAGPAGGFTISTAAPLVLVALGLFIVLLAETARIPVDDPNTHLELTMIHEVMVLDHSGPLLGAITYAASLKLFILGALLMHIVTPFASGIAVIDYAIFIGGMIVLAIVIGVMESIMARFRMRRVPYLLTGALLCCGAGFVLLVR